MFNKTSTALLLSVALVGAAQAQAQGCPCGGGGTKLNTAEITALLGNRMACATVGNEQWQEWHNGTSSGPVVDYKKGPTDKVDPSAQVGSYNVGGDDTVTYTYGSQSYKYAVCRTGTGTTFCGANYGGRDINAVVGGSGLQSCSGVTQVTAGARPVSVPKPVVTPKPATVKP